MHTALLIERDTGSLPEMHESGNLLRATVLLIPDPLATLVLSILLEKISNDIVESIGNYLHRPIRKSCSAARAALTTVAKKSAAPRVGPAQSRQVKASSSSAFSRSPHKVAFF